MTAGDRVANKYSDPGLPDRAAGTVVRVYECGEYAQVDFDDFGTWVSEIDCLEGV